MGLKVGLLLFIVYAAAFALPILVSADVFSPKPLPPSFGRNKPGKTGLHTRRPSSIALEPSMPSFEGPAKEQMHGSAHSPTVSSHRSPDSARKHFSIPKSSYPIPPPHYYYHRDVLSPKSSPPSFGRKKPRKIGPHTHGPSNIALEPSMPSFERPEKEQVHGSADSPTDSSHRIPDSARKHFSIPKSSYPIPPPHYYYREPLGPSLAPSFSPSPSPVSWSILAPGISPAIPPSHFNMHIHPPAISPLGYSWKKNKALPPSKIWTLPPPPPNKDCTSITCAEPLTNTPPGSPCKCVWPIQVKLRLGIAVYTFFTLVTELADEIAASVALNSNQVRIMGADAASEHPDKSTVLINLVPRGVEFDGTTAFSIYKKFCKRQVLVKDSLFGTYEVLYVHYPGLPPTPPSPSIISTIDDGPQADRNGSGRANKPLGVDVPRRKKDGIAGSMIAAIVLSIFIAFIICAAIAWLLLLKCGACIHRPHVPHPTKISSPSELPDSARTITFGSMANTTSMFFTSGALTYTGSAKTFSLKDIERATNDFDPSRILGQGGFGVVYSGMLDDGQKVAVKVLKRDDQHGTREFLAEVEMLSRLHHRNLVKLIGTCTDGRTYCLVYELIPNGSVESHLHGVDKETGPLDWDARMKIALGAARGLAYLHEDSSPRVIHRDFKASNILLDHDFTPKVSDFGLARTALDEGNKHISTHVMGTFGYLAPEYAMTGHLLVKSDVYSYGVVLLELLTGRKPVDLSQPLGQENLVAYARPLLTSKDGLETIIDATIKSSVSFDTIAKVAAIASMCVQPEVSHRPFMGEVVQALKLVCNEFDQAEEQGTGSCSQEKLPLDAADGKVMEAPLSHHLLPLSTSDLFSAPEGQELGSFRRHSCSGPIRTGKRRMFWQRLRSLSSGSTSDHGYPLKPRTGTS